MDVKQPHVTQPSNRVRTKTVIYSYRSSPYVSTQKEDTSQGDEKHSRFVWKKKEQQGGMQKLSSRRRRELEEQRVRELQEELHKVQEARQAREEARLEAREEKERVYRENEMLEGALYQLQEEEFFLKQTELRSRIRIEGGRAQPIDNLALYILKISGDVDTELFSTSLMVMPDGGPCDYLIGLTAQDLKSLIQDIDVYQKVHADRGDIYRLFWEDMLCVVIHEHHLLQEKEGTCKHSVLNTPVADDIVDLFKSKTLEQLILLLSTLQTKLCSDQHHIGLDVTYWEEVIQKLKVEIARQSLLEKHSIFVKQLSMADVSNNDTCMECLKSDTTCLERFTISDGERLENNEQAEENDVGLFNITDAKCQTIDQMAMPKIAPESFQHIDEFGGKYTPRKPLFHNMVHTGFSWNRYNRTHYDRDNPPPKTIFGYKFNIFYPDLIDKCNSPGYTVETCSDNADFAVLRFHAGPPYADVAFRILNRKWDTRRRSDFRNSFDGNVLQLWFRFERTYYRR